MCGRRPQRTTVYPKRAQAPAADKGVNKVANEKILIADDDKNICELLRLYLNKEGYETILAYDGQAALDMFE